MTVEEEMTATHHSRIFVIKGQVGSLSRAEFNQLLSKLERAVSNGDDTSVRHIIEDFVLHPSDIA
jgi:hypothetical protein